MRGNCKRENRNVVHPAPQAAQSDEHIKLGALVERRRPLLDLVNQEQNRLQQTADAEIRKSIQTVLKGSTAQVKRMDERIAKAVEADVAPMNIVRENQRANEKPQEVVIPFAARCTRRHSLPVSSDHRQRLGVNRTC